MWEYQSTAAASIITSSVLSRTGSTGRTSSAAQTADATVTNTFSSGATTHLTLNSTGSTESAITAYSLSGRDRTTVLNSTNTTQTLTSFYNTNGLGTTVVRQMSSAVSTVDQSQSGAIAGVTTTFSGRTTITRVVSISGSTVKDSGSSSSFAGQSVSTLSGAGTGGFATTITLGSSFSSIGATGGTASTSFGSTSWDGFGASVVASSSSSSTHSSGRSFTYNSTTLTRTTTGNWGTTTTATRSSTYPVSSAGGTQSTSSADTFTISTTALSTVTETTYTSASLLLPCIVNSVVEAQSSDWGWLVTTTGSDELSAVGVSFTRTTISATGSTISVARTVITRDSNSASFTYTSTTYASATTASSRTTTSSSTYSLGSPTSVASTIPLTATRGASVTYNTTVATTLTYSLSSTTTSSFTTWTATGVTQTSSRVDTVPTTYTGGTSNVFISYTWTTAIPVAGTVSVADFGDLNGGSSSSSLSSVVGTNKTVINAVTGTDWQSRSDAITLTPGDCTTFDPRAQVNTATPPSLYEVAVGDGFQVALSLGRLQPVGSNLAASPALPMASQCSSVWPGGPVTPVLDSAQNVFGVTTTFESGGTAFTVTTSTTTAAPGTTTVAASVAITPAASYLPSQSSERSQTNTTANPYSYGGHGWDSTTGSTLTGTIGIQRGTVLDSTGGTTTTQRTWSASSTLSLAQGKVIALETVPQAFSGTTSSSAASISKYLSFSAFPSP